MFHDIRLDDVKADTSENVDFYRVYIWATQVCSPLRPAHCMHVQPLICKELVELSWPIHHLTLTRSFLDTQFSCHM